VALLGHIRGMSMVSIVRRGDVAVIIIENPPVNALSTPVRQGIINAVAEIEADPSVNAAVLATAGRTFIAGADINEMSRPLEAPYLPEVIKALASCRKPLVAALHGSALGGGLEVALACRARVAKPGTSLGVPEVKIGLIPGSSGTQMLLRLLDFETAARMITTGRPISAEDALRLGLINRLAEADAVDDAAELARAIAGGRINPAGAGDIQSRAAAKADPELLLRLKAETAKTARGQAAPMAALELLAASGKLDYRAGLAEERAVFVHLRGSQEAKALRRLFMAERDAGRLPEFAGVKPRPMEAVGVVGAGLMGCGIGFAALQAGCRVTMAEGNDDALARGKDRMAELMEGAQRSGRLTPQKRAALESALTWTTDFADFAPCDLVVEAVFEDLGVKHEVFGKLDAVVRPDALLASNTSYLDLDAIAAGTRDPSRFLGLHFFSPAHVMRLLEVVRGKATAVDTLATGVAFGRKLGKIPIVTGVCEGFCGNRILKAYRIVAETMVEDGASPSDVDAAMTEFGFPMGPFAVQDMAGLEIAYANRRKSPAVRADGRRLGLVEMLVDSGRTGRKSGKGWYAYPDGARAPVTDPEVARLLEIYRVQKEIPHRAFTRQGIRDALLAAMRSEGEAILREGIVAKPEDVDLVMVNGYGFPAHKGGPMFMG
jgi:3-hydroxyacyl-CoA dehydrogenase